MKKYILIAVAAVLLAVPSYGKSKKKDSYETLKPLMEVYSLIQENYVDEDKTDPDELTKSAIKGMISSIDPFSSYLDAQSFKDMMEDTKAEFGGIGIEISIREGQLIVVAPIEDTPAYKLGVKAGDKIMFIEGETTEGLEVMDAVHKLRGTPGTDVTITVQRGLETKTRDFTITRAVIKIETARYDIIGGSIGYIKINEFMGNSEPVITKALDEFKKKKINKIIIDLRNNPGGLLDQAIRLADYFLPKDTMIVYTKGRKDDSRVEFKAEKPEAYKGSIAVLINRGSASASEILAGALRDNNRAVLIGTNTFGKGSVQTIIPLSDRSALRLTTAQYFTPSGNIIHGVGIKPDIELDETVPSSFTASLSENGHVEQFAAEYLKKNPEGLSGKKEVESVKVSESDLKKLFQKSTDDILSEEFLKYLRTKKVEILQQEFAQDRQIILNWIKIEIAKNHKGRGEARRVSIENDMQVKRAVDILETLSRVSGK